MNLRLRLMNGQLILVENVTNWSVNDSGLNVLADEKNYWYNKAYIAVIEEEKK